MSLPVRILLAASGALACGATVWLLSSGDGDAPAPKLAQEAPTRTAWGASPFASGDAENGTLPGFAALSAVLYGRNGRAVDFGGLSAAEYIAQWGSRARTGDVAAAYKVYQAADLCAGLSEPLPDFTTDSERDDAQAERRHVMQLCKGVSQAQVDERMRFLTMAAGAGNVDAQIDFFMEGPNGKPQDQASDEALQKWKTESLGYLTSAGQRGDAFALGLLANAYDAGTIVDPDAKTSLTYAVANAAARKITLPLDSLRSRYSQLSADEFAAAVQRGTQMSAGCCAQ
jgi:hypothetical protein